MKLVPFVAENADAALAQIHEQLGPDAVVVSVRRLPAYGISRLWHHTGNIEVVACVSDEKPGTKPIWFRPVKTPMCLSPRKLNPSLHSAHPARLAEHHLAGIIGFPADICRRARKKSLRLAWA